MTEVANSDKSEPSFVESSPPEHQTPNTSVSTTLQVSSHLEDKFFQMMGCAMAICSFRDKRILTINPAMEHLLECNKSDLQMVGSFHIELSLEEENTCITQTISKSVLFTLPDNVTKKIQCNCTIDAEKNHLFVVHTKEGKEELPPVKILVVDDNSLQQKLMTVVLKKLGFHPDVAENGHQAVMAMEQKRYDIIFMDIVMPVMNGWQAAKEIKRKRSQDAPFIIAATSNTEPDDKRRCVEAGMDSFIPKPVQLEQVRAVLQHAILAKKHTTTNPSIE